MESTVDITSIFEYWFYVDHNVGCNYAVLR